MTNINELAVIVTSLLAIALGSIWYSPLVFGAYWQKAAGLTEEDLALTKSELSRSLIVAFVSNMIVLFVIAHLVRIGTSFDIPRLHLAGALIVLIGASIASMVVWEKRPFLYFAIHTGYAALVIGMGVVVISYWPW
jgi:glucan phosphoethanolaminetransferase (alkaline phosphatase superfamily)